MTLQEYASEFWDYERSLFVSQRLKSGHAIGKSYCKKMQYITHRYVYPVIGGTELSNITIKIVDDFLLGLSDNRTYATISDVRKSICAPLRFAHRQGLLQQDISSGIIKFAVSSKPRGILTPKEVKALFKLRWDNPKVYTANLLASKTGMRIGEILALTKNDIKKDCIIVNKSYSLIDGLKGTKTGRERTVPISSNMCKKLLGLVTDKSMYLFAGKTNDKPLNKKTVANGLYTALSKIGIERAERKRRNIVLHSWRHYVATYLAQRTDMHTAMMILGHSALSTFAGYSSHETVESMRQKIKILKKL
ncbi:tyrosine-type recombinase/integrase [Treponema lecithinolyticum]